MPHSTQTSIDRSKIYLVIDQSRSDLSDATARRALLSLHQNLVELSWTYNSASGGFGAAQATAKVEEGTWARAQIEARNYGTAHIYWAPPETEGPVQMADFDDHESEFLLWSGVVSDVITTPKSDLVDFALMGLGDFLTRTEATRESYTQIRSIADNMDINATALEVASWILDSSKDYQKILDDGAVARKVYYAEGYADYFTHCASFAQLIGGHPQVAFGVRNAGGADDFGQLYFTTVADPGREQTSAVAEFNNRSAATVSPLEVEKIDLEDDTTEIVNSARVFVPYTGGFLIRSGTAENGASIARYGRREVVTPDTSVADRTQAADRAAAIVAAGSSPEVLVNATLIHDPRPAAAPGASGEVYLPLLSALKRGDVKLPIPFQARDSQDRSSRGDAVNSRFERTSSDTIQLKKSSTAAACVLVDCRTGAASKTVPNAPTGIYSAAPNIKSGGDLNGSIVLYHQQMVWTDSSELIDGSGSTKSCAVWELDRMIYVVLSAQGTTPQTYLPAIYYCDSSGNWNSLGSLTVHFGSDLTKANLTDGLDIFIGLGSAISGTELTSGFVRIYRASGSKDDPSGLRTLLWYGSVNVASTSVVGTLGNRAFFVNKVEGTSATDNSNINGLSKSVDIHQVQVYSNLGEDNGSVFEFNGLTANEFCDELAYQQPPYKHANKLILDLHNGCHRDVEADDVTGSRTQQMVHLAYYDTGGHTDGGDFAHVMSSTAGTEVSPKSTSLMRRHNTWLLGPGDTGYGAALGPDVTVAPRVVTCTMVGEKVKIVIEGNARPMSATYAIEQTGEDIEQALRGQQMVHSS